MDPLSLAGSIAGLAALTIQLIEIGTKFSSKKTNIYDFLGRLNTLDSVLKQLQKSLESQPTVDGINNLSVLILNSTQCKHTLQKILQKLQKIATELSAVKRARDALLWPFNEKEHRQAINEVESFTNIFHFAISLEGRSLLIKSTTELKEALRGQSEKIEETKQSCAGIPGLRDQLHASLEEIATLNNSVQLILASSKEISKISQGVTDLQTFLRTHNERQEQMDYEEQRRNVLRWLSSLSFEAKHRQLSEQRQAGTGGWLLHNPVYQEWLNANVGAVLWCSGIPGAGKTFITSMVIDDFRRSSSTSTEESPVLFIYADYKDRSGKDSRTYLSCLSRQLAAQNEIAMDLAIKRYEASLAEANDGDEAPSMTKSEYLQFLGECEGSVPKYYTVVDAVDEISGFDENSGTDTRSDLLQALAQLKNAYIFVTSRPHISSTILVENPFILNIEATPEDLHVFLQARITSSRRLTDLCRKDHCLKSDIIRVITDKASGMFLLARLQLEQVATAITVRHIRNMLEELSRKLETIYGKTIGRILNQSEVEASLGVRALQWVASVQRPLTVTEFTQALSIQAGDKSIDRMALIDINIILEACAGLICLQPASSDGEIINGPFKNDDSLHFVHYTFQKYFEDRYEESMPSVHCDIANTCLTYLCFDFFKKNVFQFVHGNGPKFIDERISLQAYAAPYWSFHAESASKELDIEMIKRLTDQRYPGLTRSWLQVALRHAFGQYYHNIPPGFSFAAVAVHGGPTIQKMLIQHCKVSPICFFRSAWTPFEIVLRHGHRSCLQFLFSSGFSGHPASDREWVKKVFDVCQTDTNFSHTFEELVFDNLDVVRKADHAIDFNPTENTELSTENWKVLRTCPLLASAVLYREGLVKRLLDAAWDPNLYYSLILTGEKAQSHQSQGLVHVLNLAIRHQKTECVKLLLRAGAKINKTWIKPELPLLVAIQDGHLDIVLLLLSAGANVNPPAPDSHKPLLFAIRYGRLEIVHTLLNFGAVFFQEENIDENAFYAAVTGTSVEISELLTDKFLKAKPSPRLLIKVLIEAIRSAKYTVAERLIAQRPDTTKCDLQGLLRELLEETLRQRFNSISQHTSQRSHNSILPDSTDFDDSISLSIVRWSLNIGLNINSGFNEFRTPLMEAIGCDDGAIVSLFVERGANVNSDLAKLALEIRLMGTYQNSWGEDECPPMFRPVPVSANYCEKFYPLPWLTAATFLRIYRLGNAQARESLCNAWLRGVRPIDRIQGFPLFERVRELTKPCMTCIVNILDDTDLNIADAVDQITTVVHANHNSDLPSPYSRHDKDTTMEWLAKFVEKQERKDTVSTMSEILFGLDFQFDESMLDAWDSDLPDSGDENIRWKRGNRPKGLLECD